MEDREVIIPANNTDGLPSIFRECNVFTIGNSSRPNMPDRQFAGFFASVNTVIKMHKTIIIECRMQSFSTNTQQVLKRLFEILSTSYHRCKPTVRWYYDIIDEDMLEYGEMYAEWNPKICFENIALPQS